jgi:hypothetical protein
VVNDIHSEQGRMKVAAPGRKAAFANSAPSLLASSRGKTKQGRGRGEPKPAKYHAAMSRGIQVLMIIFNVYGGMYSEAAKEFDFMAKKKGKGLGEAENAQSNWASSSYRSYYGQRLSIAINTYVVKEIEHAVLYPKTRLGAGKGAAAAAPDTDTGRPPPGGRPDPNDDGMACDMDSGMDSP